MEIHMKSAALHIAETSPEVLDLPMKPKEEQRTQCPAANLQHELEEAIIPLRILDVVE